MPTIEDAAGVLQQHAGVPATNSWRVKSFSADLKVHGQELMARTGGSHHDHRQRRYRLHVNQRGPDKLIDLVKCLVARKASSSRGAA